MAAIQAADTQLRVGRTWAPMTPMHHKDTKPAKVLVIKLCQNCGGFQQLKVKALKASFACKKDMPLKGRMRGKESAGQPGALICPSLASQNMPQNVWNLDADRFDGS